MGTGKTATSLALADEWECRRVLCLCPTSVRAVWRGQIPKHAKTDYRLAILDRGSVKRRTEIADEAWSKDGPAVFVLNYEAAFREPIRSWLLGRRWDLVICDESHRAQRQTRTATVCHDLHDVSDHRLCLSGTPLSKDTMSIWGQAKFLDPDVFPEPLEDFLWRYQNRFALGARKALAKLNEIRLRNGEEPIVIGKHFPEWWVEDTINTEEYLKRLSQIAFRVENVVLDLPPLMLEQRTFRLSRSARDLYDAVQDGYVDELETGRWPDVRGSYAITMRLQQITSGFLPDRQRNAVPIDHGKANCLADILAEAHEPVVVFCRFVQDLATTRAIADRLGLRYGEISGRRKDGLTDIATMRDGLEVVGVQDQAGGAGIDLSRARIAVDYSPSWPPHLYDQKVARLHRPPQSRPVVVYQLVCEDSVDEEIHRSLAARKGIINWTWKGLEGVRT
jgi:SNF2 family DNA or RNA helicase